MRRPVIISASKGTPKTRGPEGTSIRWPFFAIGLKCPPTRAMVGGYHVKPPGIITAFECPPKARVPEGAQLKGSPSLWGRIVLPFEQVLGNTE